MPNSLQRIKRTAIRCARASAARAALATAGLCAAHAAQAVDFGPFSLTGFVKYEGVRVSDYCPDNRCQRDPKATKQFIWADDLVQGATFGAGYTDVTLFQPYLGAKFDLPRGFKLSGLVSQRWRNGKEDFTGILYDKSLALGHEDYGSLRVGGMTTRAWSMADFPFGNNIGVSDVWASSGAGYGLLTRAIRYTSRTFDVAEGDLVLEATYDFGKAHWRRNRNWFLELWAHYGRGDLSLDAMYQVSRNGTPSAFGHGPFTAPFYDASFDGKVGNSGQSIVMLMATYYVDKHLQLQGGARRNQWSGAYARLLLPAAANPGGFDVWNFPFNVDWSQDLGGGTYKGYPATSLDFVAGALYRIEKWTPYFGLVHLGTADTDNPSDRGASNSATVATLGLRYGPQKGFEVYGFVGYVRYGHRGLSPLSMPSNSAFTNVDSRLSRDGNWIGAGAVFTF